MTSMASCSGMWRVEPSRVRPMLSAVRKLSLEAERGVGGKDVNCQSLTPRILTRTFKSRNVMVFLCVESMLLKMITKYEALDNFKNNSLSIYIALSSRFCESSSFMCFLLKVANGLLHFLKIFFRIILYSGTDIGSILGMNSSKLGLHGSAEQISCLLSSAPQEGPGSCRTSMACWRENALCQSRAGNKKI